MKKAFTSPVFWIGVAVVGIIIYLAAKDSGVKITTTTAPAAGSTTTTTSA